MFLLYIITSSQKELRALMQYRAAQIMPILDLSNQVKESYFWRISSQNQNRAIRSLFVLCSAPSSKTFDLNNFHLTNLLSVKCQCSMTSYHVHLNSVMMGFTQLLFELCDS